ncbi:MAG: nucleoside recognition domain-containing protein [Lawsonibacter sp.]
MTMTIIWTGMVALSVLCGLATGRGPEVAAAAVEGTTAAVELCLSIAGMLCLWTGVMEVMRRSGLADRLSHLLGPVLCRLFPQVAKDRDVMDSISANVSANLLGLGNAATPLGVEAVRKMSRKSPGVASDAMCMLVVCNTASIQLIPTTVATVRAAAGSAAPFDILPAVWLASTMSVGVGILACKVLSHLWGDVGALPPRAAPRSRATRTDT